MGGGGSPRIKRYVDPSCMPICLVQAAPPHLSPLAWCLCLAMEVATMDMEGREGGRRPGSPPVGMLSMPA